MDDTLQALLIIVIGGLFAPILTQLLEKAYSSLTGSDAINKPEVTDDKKSKAKKWMRFFSVAIIIQLLLFTSFFFFSKWSYFDKNYFSTEERKLIKEGVGKKKDYVIPKITIRIYEEPRNGVALSDTLCGNKTVNYCSMVSMSYEVVALRDFNDEVIFPEYFEGLYAINVIKEPGSDLESEDKNPNKNICVYDVITSMKKFERKTITTRADFLYESLPKMRKFFNQEISGYNWDMFYYPNKEDDIIGEVEFQIISRGLSFTTPNQNDVIVQDANRKTTFITPQLIIGKGECLHFNVITAKIPKLKNNENFGMKWSW